MVQTVGRWRMALTAILGALTLAACGSDDEVGSGAKVSTGGGASTAQVESSPHAGEDSTAAKRRPPSGGGDTDDGWAENPDSPGSSTGTPGASSGKQSDPLGRASPEKQIAALYDGFIERIYSKQWRQACTSYTASYAERYPKHAMLADSCIETMRLEFGGLEENSLRPSIRQVKLLGPASATVVVRVGDGDDTALSAVKERGTWKLDGPAGTGGR